MLGKLNLQKISVVLIMAAMLVITGCSLNGVGSTGQTSNDVEAVQNYFPTIPNYSAAPVNDIVNAITTVTGGVSLATGNLLGSVAINRLQALADCYREVGAVDARVYTQLNISQPVVGALAIVNQDRITQNFVNCAVGGSAQSRSTEPEPCIGTGSFTANNNNYTYIYAASDQALCNEFTTHFAQFGR